MTRTAPQEMKRPCCTCKQALAALPLDEAGWVPGRCASARGINESRRAQGAKHFFARGLRQSVQPIAHADAASATAWGCNAT